jgi:hypothetical protein
MVYLILPLNKEADIEGKHGDVPKAEAEAEAEDAVATAAEVKAVAATKAANDAIDDATLQ